MGLPTTTLNINGLNLNVFDQGSGEPILLLHGFPDSLKVWRKVIPLLLEKGYRVISYDQRGFGESDAPAETAEYRIEKIAGDALALLKHFGVESKVRLVGHDWGAQIGWALSSAFPQFFSSYTAISVGHPSSYLNEGGFEQYKKGWYTTLNLNEGFAETMYSTNDWAVLRLFARNDEEVDTTWIPDLSRPGRLTAALNWYRANIDPQYAPEGAPRTPSKVEIPVTGVFGENDPYVSKAQMVNSKNYVNGPFTYREIAGGGHWLPLEVPEEIVNIITQA